MNRTSEIDIDTAAKKLMDNEMGILLLEADEKSYYDLMAEKGTYEDRIGICGGCQDITCQLFPLMYQNRIGSVIQNLSKSRGNAIYHIFNRWTDLGYNKRHAKDPFACEAFLQYLEQIGFTNADYMLLMVK